MGEPVFPLAVPGAAVSPGTSNCSLVKAAELIGIAELVLLAIAACVTSETVKLAVPEVFRVTAKVFAPPIRAALAGRIAFGSVAAMAIASLVLMRFQFASTALT